MTLDLDNIDQLSPEEIDEAIDRAMDRLESLLALRQATMSGQRRRVEKMVREHNRAKREQAKREQEA